MPHSMTSREKDFEIVRSTFSGKTVMYRWRDYYKVYGLWGGALMMKDIFRNIRKNILNRKKNNADERIDKWRYRPVNIKKYSNWIDYLRTSKDEFVEYTDKPYERQECDPKVYAFYLPQFHAIPENDRAHGKGFTEWTNVAAACPQFVGHCQPNIPYDLGFYNTLMPGVMERQAELAKNYGVYGFCFYYYWFSGRKLLEKPLEYFLHSDIDIHFHLCWATENWSKKWDGGENELIVEQKLQSDDADKFFYDLLPYISDHRYEKIDGKPILIIYRVGMFEKELIKKFITRINILAVKHGFKGIHVLCTNAFGFDNPKDYSCEGIVEFPPHALETRKYKITPRRLSPNTNFTIVDMSAYLKDKSHLYVRDYPVFKTCFPGWDNTPRKLYSKGFCFLMKPSDFRNWLSDIIQWTREHHNEDEQLIYINAWNEWGEGATMEPTTHFGYNNLETLKTTIESLREK